MASTDPFSRAERCFAVARSTDFPGERNAAVARGIAIARRAGIALDRFDIPGRDQGRTQTSTPYSAEKIAEIMGAFHKHMRAGGYS